MGRCRRVVAGVIETVVVQKDFESGRDLPRHRGLRVRRARLVDIKWPVRPEGRSAPISRAPLLTVVDAGGRADPADRATSADQRVAVGLDRCRHIGVIDVGNVVIDIVGNPQVKRVGCQLLFACSPGLRPAYIRSTAGVPSSRSRKARQRGAGCSRRCKSAGCCTASTARFVVVLGPVVLKYCWRRRAANARSLVDVDAAALPPIDELGSPLRIDLPDQRRIERQCDRHRTARRNAVLTRGAAIDIHAVLAGPRVRKVVCGLDLIGGTLKHASIH